MENNFNQALYHYQTGFFELAEPRFKHRFDSLCMSNDLILDNKQEFIQLVRRLMRIYFETNNNSAINDLFIKLDSNPSLQKIFITTAKYHYWLGLILFSQGYNDAAKEKVETSIHLAIETNELIDLAHALTLKIKMLLSQNSEAMNTENLQLQIQKVNSIAEYSSDAELKITAHLLEGDFQIFNKNFSAAINKMWVAFELAKLTSSSTFYHVSTLAKIGHAHFCAGETEKAAIFLQIAHRSLIPGSMIRLNSTIQNLLQKCTQATTKSIFILDLIQRKILFPNKTEIDFKNKKILIEILRLFALSPEKNFSKEELTKLVWEEEYTPDRHDNLIYVNLNRLRNILKIDADGQEVLLKNKYGYHLNPEFHITLKGEIS